MKTSISAVLAATLIALFSAPFVHGQTLFYDSDGDATTATGAVGGSGTWDTSSDQWRLTTSTGTLQTYPTTSPSTVSAQFGGTPGTVTLAGSTTINVNTINFTTNTTGYIINGAPDSTIALNGTSPSSPPQIAVTTSSATNTVNAVLTGTNGLDKGGTGTLVLGGANTYTGNTTIRGGTLSVSSIGTTGSVSSNLGAGTSTINFGISSQTAATLIYTGPGETTDRVIALNMTNNSVMTIQNDGSGALNFTSNFVNGTDRSTTFTLSGSNGGTFGGNIVNGTTAITSFAKAGAGTWTLSGADNSYSGTTSVNEGTLLVNGDSSNATGAVTVNAGGTLGGNGIIGGDVTIADSTTAILAPGTTLDATTTLTLNNRDLTFAGVNSQLNLDITGTAAGNFDIIAGINDLAQAGDITFTLSGTYGTASWDVLDFANKSGNFDTVTLAGSYSGSLLRIGETWTGLAGGQAWTFEQTTGVLSVVPEPGTFAMLLGGLGMLVGFQRSRRPRRK